MKNIFKRDWWANLTKDLRCIIGHDWVIIDRRGVKACFRCERHYHINKYSGSWHYHGRYPVKIIDVEFDVPTVAELPMNMSIDANVYLNKCRNTTNIHKHFKQINGNLFIPFVKTGLLGILLIKDVKSVSSLSLMTATIGGKLIYPMEDKYAKAIVIINDYLEKNDRDILKCQDEMLEHGLFEHARL